MTLMTLMTREGEIITSEGNRFFRIRESNRHQCHQFQLIIPGITYGDKVHKKSKVHFTMHFTQIYS